MNTVSYICRRCGREFQAKSAPGIYSCPGCGSTNTAEYDPSNIFSILAARLGSGGG